MDPPKLLGIILTIAILFHIALTAKQAVVSRKSKLCGNVECEEVLFKARVKRVMGINNDPSFLNLAENAVISVVAVKFSDRPDIMEGKLNGEGPSGFFYAGAIDITPFAEFLRTAITEKKEMLMISQNPADLGDKKIVGFLHSETDLVRDYNAKNAQAAAENGLPAPEPLPIPEPAQSGHGHSHGGHGHSHGGHGHSHGHSHGHPAPTPEVAKVQETASEIPKIPEVVVETPSLNNVLGNPSKIDLSDMDLEIERMIKAEQERMEQEPLVLKSLPAEPIQEIRTPEDVADAPKMVPEVSAPEIPLEAVTPIPTAAPIEPEPIAQHIQEPTTTPIPPIPETPVVPEDVPAPDPVIKTPLPVEPVQVQAPVVPELVVGEPVVQAPSPVETTVETPPPVDTTPVAQAPPTMEQPPVETATLEDLTGVCYKENCDGLQTTPPPNPHVTLAHAHGGHGHVLEGHGNSHDGNDGHGHSHDAPKETFTTPPPISPEEAEFLKWEEERKKQPAQPYEDAQAQQFHGLPPDPPASAGLFDLVRSSLGFGNLSDASVLLYINLTFVLGSFLFYVIVRSLSSGAESDTFDRQAYFDLVTKHKKLQLELTAAATQIQNLQNNGVQQQQHVLNHDPELLNLRQQISQLQTDLQTAVAQRQDYELHYNQLREDSEQKAQHIAQLNEMINDYNERHERSAEEAQDWARQLDLARAELNESQQNANGRQQEAFDRQQEANQYQQTIQELIAEKRELTGRISQLEQAQDQLTVEIGDLNSSNSGLLIQIQQLEKDLEASRSNDAAESGGSGWSDFGDEVEEQKEEPAAEESSKHKKHEDEISKLKKKIEETEKELNRYRSLYEKASENATETENRAASQMEIKLKNAEEDVLEAKKRINEVISDKKELEKQFKDTLATLHLTISKAAENDKITSSLREDLHAKDTELRELKNTVHKKENKIQEVENECKRLQREYTKLETKSFHEVMSLKKENDDLKSTQLLGNRDMFVAPGAGRNAQLASPIEEPIWDEPDYVQPQEQDYYSSGSMASRRRSSRKSVQPESPSDQEQGQRLVKKDAPIHRRRSRSQGRQYPQYPDSYQAQYNLPGSSDSSFLSMGQQQHAQRFHPLSGRHSKSGNLSGHYSSGGSNGGRSPPPEMPLLSAMPPPGARKPMSKRPDSAHHHGK